MVSSEELRRLVGIPVFVATDATAVAREVAGRIADLVRARAAEGRSAVLGLATGSTPVGAYRELIRMHAEEGLSLANVVTFNLDEYVPMAPDGERSYHRYMRERLFDHVDVPDGAIHIPRGDLPPGRIAAHCAEYEAAIRAAGGIDLQLLGIGRDGHIGFNEPGSEADSRTRLVDLAAVTRADAAADFGGLAGVPTQAITMGVGTILEAREILLLALGERKAEIVLRAALGPPRGEVVATFLHDHPSAALLVDPAAAGGLTRALRSGAQPFGSRRA